MIKEQKNKLIIGLFEDGIVAENCLKTLEDAGYPSNDISIITKEGGKQNNTSNKISGVLDTTASGILVGAALGTLAGALIGVGAITSPGIGAILIGGPIASALGLTGAAGTMLSGAVTGAIAGSLVGTLVGVGISNDDVNMYEEHIKSGRIFITVPVREGGEEIDVKNILHRYDIQQLKTINILDNTNVPAYESVLKTENIVEDKDLLIERLRRENENLNTQLEIRNEIENRRLSRIREKLEDVFKNRNNSDKRIKTH